MARATVAPTARASQLDDLVQYAEELEAIILALEGLRCRESDLRPGTGIADFSQAEVDSRREDLQRILGFEAATRVVELRRGLQACESTKAAVA